MGLSIEQRPSADMPEAVREAFDQMPQHMHGRFRELRALIFEVAKADDRIGPLEESLKWGEPAYRPTNGVGSTVRLAVPSKAPDQCGVFFICSTNLVDAFRSDFPELMCQGNRAILVLPNAPIPDALRICLHRALTHHLAAK